MAKPRSATTADAVVGLPDRPLIHVAAQLESEHVEYAKDINAVADELERAGAAVEVAEIEFKPRRGGLGFVGPASEVVLQFDPHVLELIVRHGLIGFPILWTVKAFFKKIFERTGGRIGDKAGDAIVAALKRLWIRTYAQTRSLHMRRQHTKVDLCFTFAIEGVVVSIRNEVNPDRVDEVSEVEIRRAFGLLTGVVIPSIRGVVMAAKASGSLPDRAEATLVLPVRNLDQCNPVDVKWRARSWHWHVWLGANREYIVTPSGGMRWRT